MKQSQIIGAYKVLARITSAPVSLQTAYKLHRLKKQLTDQWDFQIAEEQKLIERYRPDVHPDGSVSFASAADNTAFADGLAELAGMDVDIDVSPVQVPANEPITLSVDDLSSLDGFLEVIDV